LLEDFSWQNAKNNNLNNRLSGPSGDALKRSEGAIAEGIYKENAKSIFINIYNIYIIYSKIYRILPGS
jgi:hypothetical protein